MTAFWNFWNLKERLSFWRLIFTKWNKYGNLTFPRYSSINGYYIIVNWRLIHDYFQYAFCKKCYFVMFGILPVLIWLSPKILWRKYPFVIYFQNAYAVLVLHNFFCSGNPFQKNDGPSLKIQFLCPSLFF